MYFYKDWSLLKIIKNEAKVCYASPNLKNVLSLLLFSLDFQSNITYRIIRKIYDKYGKYGFSETLVRIFMNRSLRRYGILIDDKAEIGERFNLMHAEGTVIGSRVKIGNNVMILNGVNLGNAKPAISKEKRLPMPYIGNNVLIGAGAKILGNITIGDNVIIGANAVVLNSFGSNVVIAGVPAKVIREITDEEKEILRQIRGYD
ncbi:MAG: serine O-acetyltransferase [bacterium]